MATIMFRTYHALVCFSSMAEGMSEVHADDGDTLAEASLDRLVDAVGSLPEGQGGSVTIDDADYSAALGVLENIHENGPGGPVEGTDDDDNAEREYILEGEITITLDPPKPIMDHGQRMRVSPAMDLREALRLGILALHGSVPGTANAEAHDWLIELFRQRGCEHLEGAASLVETCQIFIRG